MATALTANVFNGDTGFIPNGQFISRRKGNISLFLNLWSFQLGILCRNLLPVHLRNAFYGAKPKFIHLTSFCCISSTTFSSRDQ